MYFTFSFFFMDVHNYMCINISFNIHAGELFLRILTFFFYINVLFCFLFDVALRVSQRMVYIINSVERFHPSGM